METKRREVFMMRRSAWLHVSLSAYLWLIASIPLGNWNRQRGGTLLTAILAGQPIDSGDIGMLVFVTLPAVLFWFAYRRLSLGATISALIVDVVWLVLQIQSWWIPYILGTRAKWQLEYAKGPTTKVLPSFGNHVAPDGMHFVISLLLIAALVTGIAGLRQLRIGRYDNLPSAAR
jgi:hypothetical protein